MTRLPISILTFLFLFSIAFTCSAQKKKPITKPAAKQAIDVMPIRKDYTITGLWQQCNFMTEQPDTSVGGKPGARKYKFITGNKFLLIENKLEDNVLVGSFSGSYNIKDDTYTEYIDVRTPNIYGKLPKPSYSYHFKLTDSTLTLGGIDNSYNEVWKRVKP